MPDNFADALRRDYRADEWLRPEPRDVNVFTWKFKPFAVAGLTPERLQLYDVPSAFNLNVEQAQHRPVRTTESNWFDGAAMLTLTSYECDSRAAARAQLLAVLGTFQGPTLRRSEVAGEVAYAVPDDIAAVTARGNLVLVARNGGEKLISVAPLLQGIDKRLTAGFGGEEREVKGETLDVARPLADEWVHILVRGGEAQAVDGAIRLVAARGAAPRVTIAVVKASEPQG